jgi:hypothetical protein
LNLPFQVVDFQWLNNTSTLLLLSSDFETFHFTLSSSHFNCDFSQEHISLLKSSDCFNKSDNISHSTSNQVHFFQSFVTAEDMYCCLFVSSSIAKHENLSLKSESPTFFLHISYHILHQETNNSLPIKCYPSERMVTYQLFFSPLLDSSFSSQTAFDKILTFSLSSNSHSLNCVYSLKEIDSAHIIDSYFLQFDLSFIFKDIPLVTPHNEYGKHKPTSACSTLTPINILSLLFTPLSGLSKPVKEITPKQNLSYIIPVTVSHSNIAFLSFCSSADAPITELSSSSTIASASGISSHIHIVDLNFQSVIYSMDINVPLSEEGKRFVFQRPHYTCIGSSFDMINLSKNTLYFGIENSFVLINTPSTQRNLISALSISSSSFSSRLSSSITLSLKPPYKDDSPISSLLGSSSCVSSDKDTVIITNKIVDLVDELKRLLLSLSTYSFSDDWKTFSDQILNWKCCCDDLCNNFLSEKKKSEIFSIGNQKDGFLSKKNTVSIYLLRLLEVIIRLSFFNPLSKLTTRSNDYFLFQDLYWEALIKELVIEMEVENTIKKIMSGDLTFVDIKRKIEKKNEVEEEDGMEKERPEQEKKENEVE